MRDYYILNNRYGKGHPEHAHVTALASAISAYERCQVCIHKYYQVVDGKITQIAEGSPEEVKLAYSKERAKY